MKTFGMSINGWFIAMFMFLTGKDSYNLPEDTCSLFWQSSRMLVLTPITFLGALFIKLTDMDEDGKGNLWGRIGLSFAVTLGYVMLLMVGDAFIADMFMDLEKGDFAHNHLSWFAYFWLPVVGALLISIPLAILAGVGSGLFHAFKFLKDEIEVASYDNFGIEMDEETALPKNKFWAIMWMIHDKTCAKINWEK